MRESTLSYEDGAKRKARGPRYGAVPGIHRPRLFSSPSLALTVGAMAIADFGLAVAAASSVDAVADAASAADSSCTDPSCSSDKATSTTSSSIPSYSCPPSQDDAPVAENDHFDDYWLTYEAMNERNLRDLKGFRSRGYDWRRASYTQMKRDTAPFKRAYFANVLGNNSNHIYESGSGQGLNLLMTVETLWEEDQIHNITIHGNDYLRQSVTTAQALLAQEAQPWFHTGPLCQADSTNLSHIPNDTFDVAYTGFIDPIMDPLNLLGPHANMKLTEGLIAHLCASQDPLHQELAALMQERQEDWHAKWVTELLRIVKPGKFVIIEDLGWPACTEITDWAGIDPDWWTETAIQKYNWPVDPKSIAIVKYAWYVDRYNVRMQKLPTDDSNSMDAETLNQESAALYKKYKDAWREENGIDEDEDEDDEEWDDEEEDEEDESRHEL